MKRIYVLIAIILGLLLIVPISFARLGYVSRSMTPNIGLEGEQLKPCPASPNCVCSFDSDSQHGIEAIKTSHVVSEEEFKNLIGNICKDTDAEIKTFSTNYAHLTCKSALFGFVDDLELLHDPVKSLIHLRSASRVGHSDFGVNRKRAEVVRRIVTQYINQSSPQATES